MRSLLAPALLLLIACQAMAEEMTCADSVHKTYTKFFCYGTMYADKYNLSTSGTGCFTSTCDVYFRMGRTKTRGTGQYNVTYTLVTARHPTLDQKSETYDFYMTVAKDFKRKRTTRSVEEDTMIARIITGGADVSATVQKVIIVVNGKEIEVPQGSSSFWFAPPKRNEINTTYTFYSYNQLTYWKDGEKIYDVDIGARVNSVHILVGERAVIVADELFLFFNHPRGYAGTLPEPIDGDDEGGGDDEYEDGEKAKGSSTLIVIMIVLLLIVGVGVAVVSWHYYQKRQQATGFNLDGSEVQPEVAATAEEAMRHLNPTRRIGTFDLDDNDAPHEAAETIAMRPLDPERRHSHGKAEEPVSVVHITPPPVERFTTRHSEPRRISSPRVSVEPAHPHHPPAASASSRRGSAEKVTVVSVHPVSHRGSAERIAGAHAAPAERLPGTHSAPPVRSGSPVRVELAPRRSAPIGHGGGHRGSAEKIASHPPDAATQ